MRSLALALAFCTVPLGALAQTTQPPAAAPEADAEATAESAPDAETAADADADVSQPTPTLAPKITVVVVGDPDPVLVAAALEIEAHLALDGGIRLPADASLRAALRGDAGTADDGLEEVRRERRRLGLGESSDAPVLSRLGRRAGAVLVIAVRESQAGGPEALALDVRSGQFFEGSLALADPDPAEVSTFVTRRARLAARGAATALLSSETAASETADEGPDAVPDEAMVAEGPQDAGQWFEQNWPYFAAGALLAAAIAFVAVTATDGGSPPPMLRFQPGTP